MKKKVNFGFKKVSEDTKNLLINNVFTSVADNYDLMNDLMSLGIHRIWKNKMIKLCNLQDSQKVIDIATGSGDIAARLLKSEDNIHLTCLDTNLDMLSLCKNKLLDLGFNKNIDFIQSSIEKIKLDKNIFDLSTIAFGFRNFTNHAIALQNIFDSLKPGGKIVIMEFSQPRDKNRNKFYDYHIHNIIPKIGEVIAKDYDSYKYLAESIETYMTPDEVTKILIDSGFIKVKYLYLFGDIVTIHVGYKN